MIDMTAGTNVMDGAGWGRHRDDRQSGRHENVDRASMIAPVRRPSKSDQTGQQPDYASIVDNPKWPMKIHQRCLLVRTAVDFGEMREYQQGNKEYPQHFGQLNHRLVRRS